MSTPAGALDRPAARSAGRGIAYVLAAWLLFACMDAGSKLLAEDHSIIQILWVRFVSLAAIAAWLARRHGGHHALRTRHFWLQSLRSALLVTEIGLFILVITVLPLANTHAILAVMIGEKLPIKDSIGLRVVVRDEDGRPFYRAGLNLEGAELPPS